MVVGLEVSLACFGTVRYRRANVAFVESTLGRVSVDEVVNGLPVREFRWYTATVPRQGRPEEGRARREDPTIP
jgi:hypothetical protein